MIPLCDRNGHLCIVLPILIRDGWPDLVIAGEWMPLTIFLNQNGKFNKTVLMPHRDCGKIFLLTMLTSDGNADILAGNWGWNTKYWSGKMVPYGYM